MSSSGVRRYWLIAVICPLLAATLALAIVTLIARTSSAPTEGSGRGGKGSIVYLKGRNLWIAPVDGRTPPRQLTEGSLGAGYAGYVSKADRETELFFTSQEDGGSDGGQFAVFRTGIEGGEIIRVATFRGSWKTSEFSCCSVSVSPDGLYLAYTDDSGLRLQDIASNEDRLVVAGGLTGDACLTTTRAACFGNHLPLWSPQSDTIAFIRIYYEGSDLFLVRPLEPEPRETLLAHDGFAYKSWSPDGSSICSQIEVSGENGNRPVAMDVGKGKTFLLSSVLLPPLKSAPLVNAGTACVWSRDGRIAFSYVGEGLAQHVAVLDEKRRLAALLDGGPVVGWLQDGSGVVFRSAPNPLEPSDRYRLWTTGGYPERLPIDADRILAVVPD